MNFSLSRKKSTEEGNHPVLDSDRDGMNSFVAQFFVFHGEKYLGWDCFDTRKIRVGKSPSADLVLSDDTLSDIQAEFLIKGDRIMVSNRGQDGALTVNNKAVSHCIVGALDVVKIGAYTIKTKLKGIEAQPESGLTSEFHLEKTTPVPVAEPVAEHMEILTKELQSIMDDEHLDAVDLDDLFGDETEEFDESVIIDDGRWDDTEDVTEMVALADFFEDDDELAEPEKSTPSISVDAPSGTVDKAVELSWDEFTDELPVETKPKKNAQPLEPRASMAVEPRPEPEKTIQASPRTPKAPNAPKKPEPDVKNTFPASFFKVIDDEEDQDEEDFPAAFSLRDKLIGKERNLGRTAKGDRVLEVITMRGDNVLNIAHLKGREDHILINDKDHFCRVNHDEKQGTRLIFSEPLLGTINRSESTDFKAEKQFSAQGLLSGRKIYSSVLPSKGELLLSDGFYDYVLRQSFISDAPVAREGRKDDVPLPRRVLKSTAFKYTSRAVGFHIILMIILSYSITMPDKTEFKNPETYFVMVETENIHKPVKPKPKPVAPAPIPQKIEKVKKEIPKEGTQVASLRPKKTPAPEKAEAPKAGGGHNGTVVNRNVNDMGLLATLGMKTGIEIKPNDALASVTNMDAVTTSHAKEARVKLGGLVGDLGDSRIAIPTGGVINNKGAADVLRSAGIGGKGTVAALSSGNTGQREVSGAVSAPLTKKVKFKGGGISREAVAKVINDHIDEINYCYETALINDPTLMGKIEFEWVILLSGQVGEVRIKSSTVKSNEIHSCIKSAIRTWTFPKPQGSAVEVSYPFVFDVSGF